MIEKEIRFLNNNKKKLVGILHIPDGDGPFPAVIILHGFKRDKNQIIPLVLSRNLMVNNFVVLRFDFQNCGQSDGEFSDFTISQTVNDTYSAIDYLESQSEVKVIKIGLAGLSLGGGTAVIAAANDSRIKSLVAFSPLLRFGYLIEKHFNKNEIADWREQGITNYYDKRQDKYGN